MKKQMIVTTTEPLGNCFVCGRQLHSTHVEFNGANGSITAHLRCALKMAGLIIRCNGAYRKESQAA